MAKYEVLHACGHTVTVEMIGKHSVREWRLERMATEECWPCRRALQEATNARLLADMMASTTLPVLEAVSDKQRDYAARVRTQWMVRQLPEVAMLARVLTRAKDWLDYEGRLRLQLIVRRLIEQDRVEEVARVVWAQTIDEVRRSERERLPRARPLVTVLTSLLPEWTGDLHQRCLILAEALRSDLRDAPLTLLGASQEELNAFDALGLEIDREIEAFNEQEAKRAALEAERQKRLAPWKKIRAEGRTIGDAYWDKRKGSMLDEIPEAVLDTAYEFGWRVLCFIDDKDDLKVCEKIPAASRLIVASNLEQFRAYFRYAPKDADRLHRIAKASLAPPEGTT